MSKLWHLIYQIW